MLWVNISLCMHQRPRLLGYQLPSVVNLSIFAYLFQIKGRNRTYIGDAMGRNLVWVVSLNVKKVQQWAGMEHMGCSFFSVGER